MYVVVGSIALLFLILLVLVRVWQHAPEGKLEWKLAVILRVYRRRERRRKEHPDNIGQYRAMSDANMLRFTDSYAALAAAEDRTIPGPAGNIPVRIYRPPGHGGMGPAGPAPLLPVLMLYHGGGFVAGSINTHDPLCRRLCAEAGVIVVSADYRLAPEHPFPAAAEDCYAALCWAADNAVDLGADPDRLIVAGDSAGGNLATVTAMRSRDNNGPAVTSQLLIYPNTNGCFLGMPSHSLYAKGFFLETKQMEWLADRYVPNLEDRPRPYASPYQAADLTGMPPACIITARFDPMRDEGKAYADKLKAAGVTVTYRCFPGVTHGFLGMPKICRTAEDAVRFLVSEIITTIGGGGEQ